MRLSLRPWFRLAAAPAPSGAADAWQARTVDTESISFERAIAMLAAIAIAVIGALALTLLLPESRYLRYQSADGSQMYHLRWIYERIHFDPSPIEVAIIGASRQEAGISPVLVSEALTSSLGRQVAVENLSLIRPGRDLSYEVVKQLLEDHPEVKLLVLSADPGAEFSHPAFKEIADVTDVEQAPLLSNTKYLINLLYLPYRKLSNFARQRFPDLFGARLQFDPKRYLGPHLDRTLGYETPDGERVNGEQRASMAQLQAGAAEAARLEGSGEALYFRALPDRMARIGDRLFVERIVDLCQLRGVKLAFAAMPIYGDLQERRDLDFYALHGKVISVVGLSHRPELYWNSNHLNRQGAQAASAQIASAIAPLLSAP
jgi:hypothetical protein